MNHLLRYLGFEPMSGLEMIACLMTGWAIFILVLWYLFFIY